MSLQHLITCPFCIYGAGIVASGVYTAIKTLYHKEPLFFLISDIKDQGGAGEKIPLEIDGIAVKTLSEWANEAYRNMSDIGKPQCYLVAVPEAHHEAVLASLYSAKNVIIKDEQIILFTGKLENSLMEEYYRKAVGCATALSISSQNQGTVPVSELKLFPVQVFQAKSHMDKQLSGQHTGNIWPSYLYPIQVGAALTDQTLSDLQDNQGDNISAKNGNYCELTATYYAWKHSQAAYKGICHYRRIFDISDGQMQKLLRGDNEWDVILPYPSIHYPDISTQHLRYIKENDWNAMLQALEETAPEYLEAYEKYIAAGGQYFYNFNMLIARARVFDDYCDFLFRVLERIEELATPKGWERADRFAGYLGENLTTIYFLKNRDRWKIAYAGKVWLT